jgi:hypothetical protein
MLHQSGYWQVIHILRADLVPFQELQRVLLGSLPLTQRMELVDVPPNELRKRLAFRLCLSQ